MPKADTVEQTAEQIAERMVRLRKAVSKEFDLPTAAAFARHVKLSPNQWSNFETGYGRPSVDVGIQLCQKVPGLSLDWIFRGDRQGLSAAMLTKLDAVDW